MNQRERLKIQEEMNQMFESGEVSRASDDVLKIFLGVACTGNTTNNSVHPQSIIRGITINHIQMARIIAKLETTIATLNSENGKVATRVVWLTVVCAVGAVGQVVIAAIVLFR